MAGVGPMFGQLGFFHKFAGKDYEDKRPRDRYVAEAQRLLNVLDRRLESRAWILGDDYSIVDVATFPWINNLVGFYEAREIVGFDRHAHVARALEAEVMVRAACANQLYGASIANIRCLLPQAIVAKFFSDRVFRGISRALSHASGGLARIDE